MIPFYFFIFIFIFICWQVAFNILYDLINANTLHHSINELFKQTGIDWQLDALNIRIFLMAYHIKNNS